MYLFYMMISLVVNNLNKIFDFYNCECFFNRKKNKNKCACLVIYVKHENICMQSHGCKALEIYIY